MEEVSVSECKRLAASYLNKGNTAYGQAYATLGILLAMSDHLAPSEHHDHHHGHSEHDVVLRVAIAAEAFFTQPSDTAFAEVSASLDAWQAFRGSV